MFLALLLALLALACLFVLACVGLLVAICAAIVARILQLPP